MSGLDERRIRFERHRVNDWNRHYPAGSPVLLVGRDGTPHPTRTLSEAATRAGRAVVCVEASPTPVTLDAVVPVHK